MTQKNTPAGLRDLSAAVAAVHARPVREKIEAVVDLDKVRKDVAALPERLLLAAGDQSDRETFFDLDDTDTRQAGGVVIAGAALPDYRTREGKRTHRSMITIPPKLRESIDALVANDVGDDFPWTTALIALADYGAMKLKREGRVLSVRPAHDKTAAQRKAARRLIRLLGLKS